MRTSTSSCRIMNLYRISLLSMVSVAVCLMLVFGYIGFHSAWAQDDRSSSNVIDLSQEGDNGSGGLSNTAHLAEPDGLVILNDVTWRDRIIWAAQAVVAPERLSGLIPMYAYQIDMIQNVQSGLGGEFAQDAAYIGFARASDSDGDRRPRRVLPLPRQYIDENIHSDIGSFGASGQGESSPFIHVVLSSPVPDQPEAGRFWVSEQEWERGLEQIQAIQAIQARMELGSVAGVTVTTEEFATVRAASAELSRDSDGGGGTHSIGEAQSVP